MKTKRKRITPVTQNEERAERGARLHALEMELLYDDPENREIEGAEQSSVTDAVTDLLHYAHSRGWNVETILMSAQGHLDAEVKEEAR
jgi:hypothetical protein